MGLNTIFPYIFWDHLEPTQGAWTADQPQNDVAAYVRTAQEEGLNVVLRPGPYICGEHDFGGFPAWLSQVPGLVVRDYNQPYLDASKSYLTKLAGELKDLQVTKGGNILMVQVENEYGSFGESHQYIGALRDVLKGLFNVPLYTNDGGVQFTLDGGSIPGVLAEIDGDPSSGFNARDMYITDSSELGPLLDGEYYTYAPDQWGSYNSHNSTERDPQAVTQFVKDIDYVLGNKSASISFYMVHGGTNFGFDNGALWQNRTTVFTTSYDYSAPIDESGRTTELYHTMRETISKYVPKGSIPDVPEDVPRMAIPEFELKPFVPLFNTLGKPTTKPSPVPMEALGQSYGFILYEHTATFPVSGVVHPGDRPRDRVLVYINGVRKGVIDSQYQHPLNVTISLKPQDKLQLLVENLGRVDYYSRGNQYADYLRQPHKGIVGDVTIGNKKLTGWDHYQIPLDILPSTPHGPHPYNADFPHQRQSTPLFYTGTFSIPPHVASPDPAAMDTYLSLPAGIKGQAFVNGFNLGRYWLVGPQQSLYVPGTVLKREGLNEVVVLELEPDHINGTMTAEGLSERVWFNRADLDCLKCV
ncbi:hypothetical protein PRZ48_004106 [Zasmidium cellare]|uniref:Beta-galactosidase n=1 Tax=Zasmidium cellare TaxID=395010 RepID=A0ABR0EY99_ZASCE|nr:hypothetical protein PRZ48_004106 [Zasmidium cellare]